MRREIAEYAQVLGEMCPDQAARTTWPDQSYLPASVREFWLTVGVATFSRELAPGSIEHETAKLQEAFEAWFDDAATRDSWRLEPGDEPVPWRYLPPKPRLVRRSRDPYLLASDEGEEPSLFVFHQAAPVGRRLERSYLRFCCDWLFRWGTQFNSATLREGLVPAASPAVEGLDTDVERLNDGVYRMGFNIAFRDIATYSAFVLARPTTQQGFFQQPCGHYFDVKRPKSLPIDPRDAKPMSGFVRHQAVGWGEWDGGKGLIGTLAESAVWIQAQEGVRGEVRVTCDPARAKVVEAWLSERCEMLDSGLRNQVYTVDIT
jgi:hypothetical protein